MEVASGDRPIIYLGMVTTAVFNEKNDGFVLGGSDGPVGNHYESYCSGSLDSGINSSHTDYVDMLYNHILTPGESPSRGPLSLFFAPHSTTRFWLF